VLDYYSLLSVSRTASEDEIRSSYKVLIKKWHPDLAKGDATMNELMTRQLNEAYEVLSDPGKRRVYDLSLERAKNEREKWMQYARNPKRDNTPRETTVKGPSFDNFEDIERKNRTKLERERLDKWMVNLSRYMADHQWASNTFEKLSENLKLKAMAGNLTLEDAFFIYCTFQMEKSTMGIKTNYFNSKKIKQILETSKTRDEMEVGMQLISKEELILQLFLKVNAGLFKKIKLTEEEYRVIQKFMKFHSYLLKKNDDFFAGVTKFSISKNEWDVAKELIKMEVKFD
jgi:curved DNA-binding protein CbpA